MSVDPRMELNDYVTAAILRAERLADERSAEAANAYGDVSRIEEALAALSPADDLEGAVARVGAVTAALRASQFDRASSLAQRYCADPALSDARRHEISMALSEFAPRGQGTLDPLRRARQTVRRRFSEAA